MYHFQTERQVAFVHATLRMSVEDDALRLILPSLFFLPLLNAM